MTDRILVQTADFSVATEYDWLVSGNTRDGAVVSFVGRMRDLNLGDPVTAMELEHYPGMTEKSLQALVAEARGRWQLGRVGLIHRVGRLEPGDQIVWVGTTSPHRGDAFAAADFIMDALKTRAPFWKKEITAEGERWLEARNSDAERVRRWQSE